MARNGGQTGRDVRRGERKVPGGWLRVGLLFLLLASLSVGPWAQLFPAYFWEGFLSFGRAWVSTDGP